MTYAEGFAGLQLVSERQVGVQRRAAIAAENAQEDRSKEALRREQQEMLP